MDKKRLFATGLIVSTPAVVSEVSLDSIVAMLTRHQTGDWGEVDMDDWARNDEALVRGGRLLSAYTYEATKVWVITEADRSVTTFLLPEEY